MNKKLLLSGLLILNFFVTPLALAETIDENIQNQTKKSKTCRLIKRN